MNRRHFLGLGAAGAALLPFVPMLEGEARGAGNRCKRLVVFHTPNGSILRHWRPTGTKNDFSLSHILEPLAAYKDDMIVLDGLDNLPSALAFSGDLPMLGKGHHGSGSVLTQQPALSGDGGAVCDNGVLCDWPVGPSIDQYVAGRLQDDPNTSTLHRSIAPGVGISGSGRQARVFYDDDGQPVNPENNPQKIFDKLFADALLEPDEKAKLKHERQSVIDVVKGELDSLQNRLGAHDKQRMDAHLEGIFELEKIIHGTIGECSLPSDPETGDLGYGDLTSNALRPEITDIQFELAAHALACDLTRVVSYQWGREGSTGTATWLGQNRGIHTVSHWEGVDEATAIEWMADLNRWYAGRLAAFVQSLIDKGVWDDTMVVWTTTMGEGNSHNARNLQTVILQGGGGYFETGRYLRFGDYPSIVPPKHNTDHGGQSMNRLLTSVCHAMGFDDVDCFGDPQFGQGPLPGL
jgi:hypothetical protein